MLNITKPPQKNQKQGGQRLNPTYLFPTRKRKAKRAVHVRHLSLKREKQEEPAKTRRKNR